MKKIAKILAAVAMMFFVGVAALPEVSYAGGCIDTSTGKWKKDCESIKTSTNTEVNNMVKNGINLFIGVIGVLAVAYTIYGGFLYVTSGGDAGKVKQARSSIIYGVVGLVLAMLSFAIVNFVIKNLFK